MKSEALKTYIAAAVILFGFAAVFGLSNSLEKIRPELPENYIDEDLSLQGEKLKGFSFGFEGLLADWYWMRSLQYIGNKVLNSDRENLNLDNLKPLNPKLLYPLLDNAATLDPRFTEVYSYGAVVLPAINPEQAVEFTEKGIEDNPGDWRLYQHLGYIYWRLEKYEKAAETYEKGSEIKAAPPFMKLMAAKMKSEGGSRETARQIYRQMLEQSNDQNVKETAALRLLQIDALFELDVIKNILESYKKNRGTCPESWHEIFPLLNNQKTSEGYPLRFSPDTSAPVDPTGIPYKLESANGECNVSIDTKQSKIPAT